MSESYLFIQTKYSAILTNDVPARGTLTVAPVSFSHSATLDMKYSWPKLLPNTLIVTPAKGLSILSVSGQEVALPSAAAGIAPCIKARSVAILMSFISYLLCMYRGCGFINYGKFCQFMFLLANK